MTDISKATPRPWQLNSRAIEQSEPLKGEKFVSVIAYLEDEQTDEWRANAALIVRAVNAYDAMQEALEAIRNRTASLRRVIEQMEEGPISKRMSEYVTNIDQIARAAIAEPLATARGAEDAVNAYDAMREALQAAHDFIHARHGALSHSEVARKIRVALEKDS